MFKFALYVFISLASSSAVAQYPDPSLMNDREFANYYIEQLQSGALVVRLNFKTKAVNALLQAGNKVGADQVKKLQEEHNQQLMRAFTNYFKFCPVYFISFDSTQVLQEGKLSGVFLDEEMKVDPSIRLNKTFFLFAEEGLIENTVTADKTQPDVERTERGPMGDALIIRNKALETLRDPFPYYVYYGDIEGRVKKLDKKLQRFNERE